jgi:hypothetical protein
MNYAPTIDKKLYLCSQNAAKTGGASAIGTSSIAFGLHRLCMQNGNLVAVAA